MKAILLAAGLGSRLGPLTRDIPKAIISVGSQTLIKRVIRFANQIDVDEIIVIGGYHSQRLWKEIKNENILKIENHNYRMGNLYTLEAAKEHVTEDFVIMNIDHLYPSHLARMIGETEDGVWAVSDFDRPLFQDDMKILIEGNLYEKAFVSSISKELEDYDGGYCGITIVRGKARNDYMTAFKNVLNHGREQAVVEDIISELIRLGNPPRILDISGIRWLEIDNQEDLANAERILRMKPHFLD